MPVLPILGWPPSAKDLTMEDLRGWQVIARTNGRCGSLQTSTGLPCLKDPRPGFTVCWRHGARAPQTMAKAERLLAVARMPAIEALLGILDQWHEDICTTCGYPKHGGAEETRAIITTAKLVLDRTGLGPRATLDLNTKKNDDSDALFELMTQEERQKLASLVFQLNSLKASVRARMTKAPAVVEGVALIEGSVVERQVE